jgi:hypothetical protein
MKIESGFATSKTPNLKFTFKSLGDDNSGDYLYINI